MRIALIVSVLAGAPVAAHAGEAPGYDDSDLRKAIPPKVSTIGVTVVGEFDARAAGARDAVTGALRAAGYRVRLVGGAPGTFAEEPTPAVAERLCWIFHMDLVAVVHPGVAGLAVELLDRTGAVVARPVMNARPSTPLAPAQPPGGAREPGAPVDPRVRALGEELYASQRISVGAAGSAYQGRGRRPLEGADFYSTVGRSDLAEQYRSREHNKSVARGIGGVTVGVGVIWGIADLLYTAAEATFSAVPCLLSGGSNSQRPESNQWCDRHEASPLPWGMAVVGLGLLVVPSGIPSDPVPEAERRQLIDRYNADLRARAGLDAPPSPAGDRLMLRLAPVITTEGGGVMLSGRF
jgi:hypothetical protein